MRVYKMQNAYLDDSHGAAPRRCVRADIARESFCLQNASILPAAMFAYVDASFLTIFPNGSPRAYRRPSIFVRDVLFADETSVRRISRDAQSRQ